jgi:3'-phosphoadenosine 5'-phosphosulfate sulfotransferase (PAPS reductase)/FAD synthetase
MRYVSWFSNGAASAVATKLAIAKYKDVQIFNCVVMEEHEDNIRFADDCAKWFGQEITFLSNDEYNASIYEVFEKKRYISGRLGAPCTTELKKKLREEMQQPDDIHVFGYTVDEKDRVDRFIDANNDVEIVTPLIDEGLTKIDCLAMIQDAGIELPAMYKLGYKNNNCLGCVKAQSPSYWLKIKQDFPYNFNTIARLEAKINCNLIKYDKNNETIRCKLTEIPDHFERS